MNDPPRSRGTLAVEMSESSVIGSLQGGKLERVNYQSIFLWVGWVSKCLGAYLFCAWFLCPSVYLHACTRSHGERESGNDLAAGLC